MPKTVPSEDARQRPLVVIAKKTYAMMRTPHSKVGVVPDFPARGRGRGPPRLRREAEHREEGEPEPQRPGGGDFEAIALPGARGPT